MHRFNTCALSDFEIGDLVFRKEDNIISDLFASKGGFPNSDFSHVGIVVETNPKVVVAHIYDRGENALHFEDLDSFWENTIKKAVYRHNNFDRKSFQKYLSEVKDVKWKFDYLFSLENSSLYCSEFVYLSLKHSAVEIKTDKIIDLYSLINGAMKIE